MDTFWKAAAVILLSVILSLALEKQERDMSVLLSIAACCLTATIGLSYLESVLDFLRELERTGNLQNGSLDILLKATGIALVAELAGMVCSDAGCGTMAKGLRFLSSAAILYLSLPVFRALLNLVQELLGVL